MLLEFFFSITTIVTVYDNLECVMPGILLVYNCFLYLSCYIFPYFDTMFVGLQKGISL